MTRILQFDVRMTARTCPVASTTIGFCSKCPWNFSVHQNSADFFRADRPGSDPRVTVVEPLTGI